MAIITLNNRAINRSDTASSGQAWTATSATASDFQDAGGDNTPYFYAYKSSNTNISDATWTVVVFDTEKQDSASAYNTSTGIFTVPSGQGGQYYLEHGVRVEASTSQVDRMFCYGESGGGSTQYWGNGSMDFRGNAGQGTTVYGSGIITLAAATKVACLLKLS